MRVDSKSGILVELVARVIVIVGKGEAVRSFFAVADGVILIGAVAGIYAAIGLGYLSKGVIAPGPARQRREGGATGGDSGALANDIHGLVILRNHGAANFVLVGVELGPAIWDDG